MDVSTPLAFLTDICRMNGIKVAQVKVSLTCVTYKVVLNATKICSFQRHVEREHKWFFEKYLIILYNSRFIWKKKTKF